ncbi:cationic trypsin-3-like [Grammomys surdaster]|uniref:cationic trypsin-3-like n=1 Tax=Grammomys surdaster TaxID=491861 RepID=UPI00109FC38E|nr:cationic trypsin-3-like [Grammomys surdaster]
MALCVNDKSGGINSYGEKAFFLLPSAELVSNHEVLFLVHLGAAAAIPTNDNAVEIIGGYTCKSISVSYQAALNVGYQFQLQLYLGELNIHEIKGKELINATKFIFHPNYDNITADSGIMLIKLNSPTTINSHMSTVSGQASECLMSGWGDTVSIGSKYYLGQVQNVRSPRQCDSGGPMVCNTDLQDTPSWGTSCSEKGKTGVYTKVSNYLDWIQGTTNAN